MSRSPLLLQSILQKQTPKCSVKNLFFKMSQILKFAKILRAAILKNIWKRLLLIFQLFPYTDFVLFMPVFARLLDFLNVLGEAFMEKRIQMILFYNYNFFIVYRYNLWLSSLFIINVCEMPVINVINFTIRNSLLLWRSFCEVFYLNKLQLL